MNSNNADQNYMTEIYLQYHRLMRFTAQRYFSEPMLVDDIVSDSCVALMRRPETLRTLRDGRLRMYIVATVRNTAISYYRKQQTAGRRVSYVPYDVLWRFAGRESVEGGMDLRCDLEMIRRTIADLPQQEAAIMRMKLGCGLSNADIAREIGLSLGCVYRRLRHARAQIRAALCAN